MRYFIFITTEGYTYQPDSVSIEPDIENCQVLGFGQGIDEQEAFIDFNNKNLWLNETKFDKVIAYELKNIPQSNRYFNLKQ